MAQLDKTKILLKNKQVKNLSIFIPKKSILVKTIDLKTEEQKEKRVKTGLTGKQLRYIKRYKNCYEP